MPRTRKDEAPLLIDEAEVTGRYVEPTIYAAGDAYFAVPGHVPWPHAGTEVGLAVSIRPDPDRPVTWRSG